MTLDDLITIRQHLACGDDINTILARMPGITINDIVDALIDYYEQDENFHV